MDVKPKYDLCPPVPAWWGCISPFAGPWWQNGNTLASHLWGRGSGPGTASSGKAGSCLPLVGSLQYGSLTNSMYWFPLPFQLPIMIWPVECWKRRKTPNKYKPFWCALYFLCMAPESVLSSPSFLEYSFQSWELVSSTLIAFLLSHYVGLPDFLNYCWDWTTHSIAKGYIASIPTGQEPQGNCQLQANSQWLCCKMWSSTHSGVFPSHLICQSVPVWP